MAKFRFGQIYIYNLFLDFYNYLYFLNNFQFKCEWSKKNHSIDCFHFFYLNIKETTTEFVKIFSDLFSSTDKQF